VARPHYHQAIHRHGTGSGATAFAAFAEGAALIGRERRYERSEDEKLLNDARTMLDRGYFDRLVPSEICSDRRQFPSAS